MCSLHRLGLVLANQHVLQVVRSDNSQVVSLINMGHLKNELCMVAAGMIIVV